MIIGFAINGHDEESLSMCSNMLRYMLVSPDEIHISVSCAVGHLEIGKSFFTCMTIRRGICWDINPKFPNVNASN